MHWQKPSLKGPNSISASSLIALPADDPSSSSVDPASGVRNLGIPPAAVFIDPHVTPTIKNHSATHHAGIIYVYGGYDGRRNHKTLQAFDVRHQCWRKINPRCVHGVPPPGRNGHTATLADVGGAAHVVIIGGWLGTGPLAASDTHVLDVSGGIQCLRWIAPEVTGIPPGPCNMHSADFVRGKGEVYVFRGGNGREYLNDLHALDVRTYVWRKVDTTGSVPHPRANHSSAVVERTGELFIFGGWNGKERLNDIHVLDTMNSTWSTPQIKGVLPHPRAGMTLASLRDCLFLFGGSGTSSKCFHDLQILDRNEMTWLDVSVQEEEPVHSDDRPASPSSFDESLLDVGEGHHSRGTGVGSLDKLRAESLAAHRCRDQRSSANPNDEETPETITIVGQGPGRRAGHTATAVGRNIYVFGGSCGSDYLSDFFVLDTDPPPEMRIDKPSCQQLLESRLRHFFNDEEFSDVIFKVEGRRIHGHRILLSLVSDCFRAMFSGGFLESSIKEIEIPDCSSDIFLQMMEYLYTGQIPEVVAQSGCSPDEVGGLSADALRTIQLLELADRFMLDHLKQVCEGILKPLVDAHTCEFMLDVALRMNAPQLEQLCRFYQRNREVASDKGEEEPQESLFEADGINCDPL